MNPALLIAGAAAVLLLGGKKKTKSAAPKESEDSDAGPDADAEDKAADAPPIISSETDAEVTEDASGEASTDGEGATDEAGSGEPFKSTTVARGIRKDRLGHRGWRIQREADGYHAQIMTGISLHDRVAEDLGVTATIGPARTLLRDTFNSRLLAKYPKELPQDDPPKWTSAISPASTLNYKPDGSGGGGGGQGLFGG